ncbi:leucine-rich repeat-containing protein 2 isoform X2 [Esox lucius]|uniref:leucine-rich repeat-containing protein 2 isoform X2 n=1 Tax=Esox lucius TaxID=8010 RepID=UPI00057735FD|nr:leucine-rich repeat-containing protein 2 isoform X2 [Esox lucius]
MTQRYGSLTLCKQLNKQFRSGKLTQSFSTGRIKMRADRSVDIPIYDISQLRGMWEHRVIKYKEKQKKERERIQNSALEKINQEWQYRIECKKLQSNELEVLQHYLGRTAQNEKPHYTGAKSPLSKFILEMDGDDLAELPESILDKPHLREMHIRRTTIYKIPGWIEQFPHLSVINMPKNGIQRLPVEIGKIKKLRVLILNYNRITSIPPELGDCENLEKLELTGNFLEELPFELSKLKKVTHLDLAENTFASIPICALRMTSLKLLDLSINMLTDLPEDMDRNDMEYLPNCLENITTLRMVVVSGDTLKSWPPVFEENSAIKFIKLYDNTVDAIDYGDEEILETMQDHEKEFMKTYIHTLKERETAPTYTTKVSFSCFL